jgi:hypothetical protein
MSVLLLGQVPDAVSIVRVGLPTSSIPYLARRIP